MKEGENHWSFFFFLACTAPSCICQQEVRCVHRCSEGASSSLTSLSLSPVTLTLGVSAQPQILPASLPVTKTPSTSPSLSYICIVSTMCFVIYILHCVVTAWLKAGNENGGHTQNYNTKKDLLNRITNWNLIMRSVGGKLVLTRNPLINEHKSLQYIS